MCSCGNKTIYYCLVKVSLSTTATVAGDDVSEMLGEQRFNFSKRKTVSQQIGIFKLPIL